MSTSAEIQLWGRPVAVVTLPDEGDIAAFEYDDSFLDSGVEPAPLMMPVKRATYRFPGLAQESFKGLPGLLADSLPDKFGNAVINAWLARQGRSADSFNAVERLCYTGTRGMGALEFFPASGPPVMEGQSVDVGELVSLASQILTDRSSLQVSFDDKKAGDALVDILKVGTSAGGARAKAVIAWNPATNEVRSGQVERGTGFEHWLIKFDGVSENRDKELADPQGYGAIEYAYYLMARAAGIQMSECRLFEENGRRHFMTRRFDRNDRGRKRHMQSLCAMEHLDFNQAGAHSYEQAFLVLKKLEASMQDREELFRRAVFNIVARNQDDHTKNIAFLMNKSGEWSLAPGYDITYAYNPEGAWTSRHQLTLNGKTDGFTREDLKEAADVAGLKRGLYKRILDEVEASVRRWEEFADQAELEEERIGQIEKTFRWLK